MIADSIWFRYFLSARVRDIGQYLATVKVIPARGLVRLRFATTCAISLIVMFFRLLQAFELVWLKHCRCYSMRFPPWRLLLNIIWFPNGEPCNVKFQGLESSQCGTCSALCAAHQRLGKVSLPCCQCLCCNGGKWMGKIIKIYRDIPGHGIGWEVSHMKGDLKSTWGVGWVIWTLNAHKIHRKGSAVLVI